MAMLDIRRLGATCVLAAACAPALGQPLTHIQTIDTSATPVVSPDTSGIVYMPGSGHLLTVDSEVNETPHFVGINAYELSLDGSQPNTFGLSGLTNEPTGIAFDPVTGHLFVSDDQRQDIHTVGPGPNGVFDGFPDDGGDDVQLYRVQTDFFGNNDPEGLTFSTDEEVLYVAGGIDNLIYRLSPGPNGVFDGVPPASDDEVTSFDTAVFGLTNPEGIAFDPDSGYLYIVGKPRDSIFHVTVNGQLVRTLDVPPDIVTTMPAGVAMAPSSLGGDDPNPTVLNLYVADRGVDNNWTGHELENDGRIYEFSVPELGDIPNLAPFVNAGDDQVLQAGVIATLAATVTDDGMPDQPAPQLSVHWTLESGPGTVVFGNAVSIDTTASFSVPGLYLLRLEADDGEFTGSDVLEVAIQPPPPALSAVYISTGGSARLGGEKAKDEDIWRFDFATGLWTQFFDGSDVGLGASGVDVDAFHLNADGSFLISLSKPATVTTLGAVDDSDILRFVPTQTGETTAGTFEWYLDASDVGLEASTEDISAIAFAPDGRLLVSTTGWTIVDGVLYRDEDLLVFDAVQTGIDSIGTFSKYFDGSDVGLSDGRSNEEVYGAWVDATGEVYLTTRGDFTVPGVSGTPADIFNCTPTAIGETTGCLYQMVFEGGFYDLTDEQVDAFYIEP